MPRADDHVPDRPTPLSKMRDAFARTPFRDRRTEASAGRLGLLLFLASLGMVFAATIVAVVAIRLIDAAPDRWRPADGAGLPWELLLSTAVLLAGSATIERARRAVRMSSPPDPARTGIRPEEPSWSAADSASGHDERRVVLRWLRITTGLGIAFVLVQTWCWIRLIGSGMPPTESLFGWIFTVLTVLHAIHVLCGLAALGLVTLRAEAGRYTRSDHSGIDSAALYWHFLDIVWIVLLITLWAIA